MAASTKRVVWDASVWIALISDEKVELADGSVQDRGQMARTVHRAAERGQYELVTPALALVEVCKKQEIKADEKDKITAFFEHDYVLVVAVDTAVATTARGLVMTVLGKGLPNLKPADATYVATCAEANVAELHTFDQKLINLSGQFKTIDGTPIVIRHPDLEAGSAPLLEEVA